MTATPVVLIGAGENAQVLAEAVRAQPERWALRGFVGMAADRAAEPRLELAWLGTDDEAERLTREPELHFVLAVGGTGPGGARGRLAGRYAELGARFATVVHPRAVISPSAEVAPGAVVYAGAVVNSAARVGAHALIGCGAVVEHDVTIEDLVLVGPGAVIGGGATIERGAYLGLGCRVRDHVRVGAGALVAMGAVLVGDARPGAMLLGVPARERATVEVAR